jgi:hypothetical protein
LGARIRELPIAAFRLAAAHDREDVFMNIGQIKLFAWTAAGVLTLGLAYYVFDFVRHLEEKGRTPDLDAAKKTLDSVQAPAIKSDDILSYDEAKRLIAVLDWTGAPKAVVVPVSEVPVVPVVQVIPVSRLVTVLALQQDLSDPALSQVALRYKPEANVSDPLLAAFSLLKEGDHLAAPNNGVTIVSITSDAVEFAFADEKREHEKLTPKEFDAKSQIIVIGPDGIVQEPTPITIPKGEAYRPGKSTEISTNRFRLGTDDVKEFGNRYQEILGREVETARHQDPRTGKYDGIEIKSVQAGSIAERHGAQVGDVVKSINGHAVNSTQEAIHFVQVNQGQYSTWEVVIENHGKTRTVTYESGNN